MASLVINGNTSGGITLSAPAVAGSNTISLPASTGTAALTSDVIGVNQTWNDVTASRALTTTYTNTTGKPIMVNVRVSVNSVATMALAVGGLAIATARNDNASVVSATLSAIVPNNVTYSVTKSGAGTGTINLWSELY